MFSKSNTSSEDIILKGPLITTILTLSLPIIMNNFIGTLYNLGDAYWVSRLGDIPMAAINFVWPVSFLTFSIALGISIGGGSIISQYIGAGKIQEARETTQQLYIFGALFGIFSSILGWIITPSIIQWMNATGDLYINSVAYLRILFIEMPFLFIMNIFFTLNQARGDTITPTIVNGSSAVLNILIDPLFIFTFNLGIEGAAWATVLSKVPFTLYGIYQLSKGHGATSIAPFDFSINKDKMKDLLRIGLPSSAGRSGVALGFIVLFALFATYGDNALTAVGIGNRLNGLAFMPAIGIGAALSTITAQNLGAGNIDRIKKAFHVSLALSILLLAIMCLVLWFFAYELISIFSTTEEVLELGVFYLRILALTTWSVSFFNCSIGLFNGSGHTKYSMYLEAGRLWLLRMPLILVLGLIPTIGVNSIWYAIGLSNVIASTIAFVLTFRGTWKHARLNTIAS